MSTTAEKYFKTKQKKNPKNIAMDNKGSILNPIYCYSELSSADWLNTTNNNNVFYL